MAPGSLHPHLAIRAQDMDRTAEFFRQALGLEPRGDGKGVARFGAGDLTIEVLAGPDLRPEDAWGPNPLLPGFQTGNLFAAVRRLEANGAILLTGMIRRRWGMFVYFQDPDGNTWQIFQACAFQKQVVEDVVYWVVADPGELQAHLRDRLAAAPGAEPAVPPSVEGTWSPAEMALSELAEPLTLPAETVHRAAREIDVYGLEPPVVRQGRQVVDGDLALAALRELGKGRALVYRPRPIRP